MICHMNILFYFEGKEGYFLVYYRPMEPIVSMVWLLYLGIWMLPISTFWHLDFSISVKMRRSQLGKI
jgi:hypothetical protein